MKHSIKRIILTILFCILILFEMGIMFISSPLSGSSLNNNMIYLFSFLFFCITFIASDIILIFFRRRFPIFYSFSFSLIVTILLNVRIHKQISVNLFITIFLFLIACLIFLHPKKVAQD